MKKILVIAAALLIAVATGCGRRQASAANNASAGETTRTHQHDHSKDAHDHAGHDHSTHDHAECVGSHDEHNYAGHDHAECSGSHDNHSHADHSHAGDSHAGHDHSHAPAVKPSKKAKKADPHAGHDHSAEFDAEGDPDEIVFPASQAARTDFKVEAVARADFREVIRCGGTISAAQTGVSVISAPVSGIVIFSGGVVPNAKVSKGQALFGISSGGLASGDAVAKARIAYEQAAADYERVKGLYEDKLVTGREYLAAEAEYLRAKSEYEPLMSPDGSGGSAVKSPVAGYISRVEVSPGDYVEMGAPLATVLESGRMQLTAYVSQKYFDRIANVADANFRTPASADFYNVSALNGRVYSSGGVVPGGSTLIPVVFELDNNGRIPDGTSAEVALLGRKRAGIVTLPLTAVTEQQGLYYVYVQLDEECYNRREVRLGGNDGIRVEIVSGVEPGERVVTRGAVNVKMAAASGAIPHGHSH